MKETDNNPGTAPVADNKFIINIGRQLGSGGRQIGRILAKEFGIAYFDKEILALAAKESGFCEEIFQRNDEKKGFFNSMFGSVLPVFGSMDGDFYGSLYGNQLLYGNQVSDENLFLPSLWSSAPWWASSTTLRTPILWVCSAIPSRMPPLP